MPYRVRREIAFDKTFDENCLAKRCVKVKERSGAAMERKIRKDESEWKEILTPEEYHITREKGTERAFSGKYWDFYGTGIYRCVCCGAELFDSKVKYESGSGWPSFYMPVDPGRIEEERDTSFGMLRTEVKCGSCGAHLGHLFDDGPRPTGLRYCVNSAALRFEKKK